MTVVIRDGNTEYTSFIAETLDGFSKHKIKGIAIVGIVDGSYELTGYWNMDLKDKLQAESALRFDVMDTFLLANKDRYSG